MNFRGRISLEFKFPKVHNSIYFIIYEIFMAREDKNMQIIKLNPLFEKMP